MENLTWLCTELDMGELRLIGDEAQGIRTGNWLSNCRIGGHFNEPGGETTGPR
jgi:hypothetical protein